MAQAAGRVTPSSEQGLVALGDLASESARRLLETPGVEAVEIAKPPLDETPYREFVRALLRASGFKLEFNGQPPDAVLAKASNQLLGPGRFEPERRRLAEDISVLEAFVRGIAGGARPNVSIRTYFAPGDLVWHLDRSNGRNAYRLVWPLGRAAGMWVTPADNIDGPMHRAFMQREHPLLCKLDSRVLRTGATLEALWAHRPAQVAAMTSGRFPFLRNPRRQWQVQRDAASVHRIETPSSQGTYHRSSWENHTAPGLQVVMTAASS